MSTRRRITIDLREEDAAEIDECARRLGMLETEYLREVVLAYHRRFYAVQVLPEPATGLGKLP